MQGETRNIYRIKKQQSLPGGGNDCCFVLTGEEQQ